MALSLADAKQQGLSRHVLRNKQWQRIGSKMYRRVDAAENSWQTLAAWSATLPAGTVFCGTTAAWALGLGYEPAEPVQVAVPPGSGTRSRVGLVARRCLIAEKETVVVRGLRITNLTRTLLDLCVQLPPVEALVGIDRALSRRKISRSDLVAHSAEVAGRPGAAILRRLVTLAEPAESPQETRLRWLCLKEGLGRPEVQKNIYDETGHLIGRADLYYPTARLVIEFDGAHHKQRLVSDDRRQNLIVNAGYQILRFTTSDLLGQPEVIVSQLRAALATPRRRR